MLVPHHTPSNRCPNDLQLSREIDRHLLLEILLDLTERTIISLVRALIRLLPARAVDRKSSAARKLAKLKGLRQDAIESAYAVWRGHHQSRDGRQAENVGQAKGTKSLYQIGKELRLVKSCMPAATDDEIRSAKRVTGMKVGVSRMLVRPNNLIENAAAGSFPNV